MVIGTLKQTHALINKNNAHQADSDAKVTYQLFTNQLAKLNAIVFSGNSEQFDTFKLIEFIFLNPDTILDIVTDFGLDTFPKDFEKDNIIILTETQLNQMGWIKNLNIKIFDSSARAANPVLDYDTIKMIAEDSKNIFLKLISIVLYNASKNNVQIFLSMIPNWLISNDKIKSEIIRLHSKNTNIRKDSSNTVDCHLINDILKLGNQARNKVLSKKQITVFDKKELLLYWSNTEKKKEIKEKEVEKQYPEIIGQIKGQSLFKINNSDIMSWVFYETPGLKDMVSHWSFLPPFPEWLNQIKEYQTQDQNQNLSIVIPSWIDGDTSNLALDRIFVSHSTKNRILYLSDVLERSINILKTVSDDSITIIAMKWSTEANQLQKYLVQLEFSSDHSESFLRNLEYVKNKGFKAMACSMQDLSNYINAAKELKISINIIIDQLPVYQWYVLDYKIGTNSSQSIEKTTIRNFDLIKLVNDNLYRWVSSLVDSHTQMKINVFIIDSILMANSRTDYKGVKRAEVPFFGVNELFDNNKYEVFKKYVSQKLIKNQFQQIIIHTKDFLIRIGDFLTLGKGLKSPQSRKLLRATKI